MYILISSSIITKCEKMCSGHNVGQYRDGHYIGQKTLKEAIF